MSKPCVLHPCCGMPHACIGPAPPVPMCTECKNRALYGDIERDTGFCGYCADRMYEREQERREWEYYHHD